MVWVRMVDPDDLQWPPRKLVRHLKETLLIELVLNPGTFRIQVFTSSKRVHVTLIAIEASNHEPTTLVWVSLLRVVVDFAHDA